MSNPGDADETPITSVKQLADYIAVGCKPRAEYRIGTEHEKFGFRRSDLLPPPYAPDGIGELLERLSRDGSKPIRNSGNTIGLKQGGASISLEPAGQFELSGAPLETLHQTRDEFAAHFAAVRDAAEPMGLGFAPLGSHPIATRAQMPWMPKSRYAIMRRYMPLVGSMGLDMMTRTCTVQVNLDYELEADMARKLRVSLALQPLATALFANSPFTEGRANGLMSWRAHVWTDTDNQRSGIPAVMLDPHFGFLTYVNFLIDEVPMYFIYRNSSYVDLAGRSFRDFMEGRLRDYSHIVPTIGDFADHMTTAFTDVRLKRFLEMRGADAGRPDMMIAQSALWVGLLYDDAALSAAAAFVRDWSWEEIVSLRNAVPRLGLAAPWRGKTLRDIVSNVLAISTDGLRARARHDQTGADESIYLDPLRAISSGEPTQAEYWLSRSQTAWRGDIRRIFGEAAI